MASHPGPVFITGASGFIGRHIVERLSGQGYEVRALVRRAPSRGFDPSVEVIVGDLTQVGSYAPALNDASAVIHAALAKELAQNLSVTSTLQHLSARAGVRRFIHLSSISVYGNPADGTVTEDTQPIPTADAYSRTKLAIEEALRTQTEISETVILRLGCVYGPGGGWWTQGLLNLMEHGRLILINEGAGTANLIHVADIGAIIPLVLARSNPTYDVFNVTDGRPVAWRRYFSELETLLGRTRTVSMSVAEAQEYGRKWLRPSLMRRAIRRLLGTRFVLPLDDRGIQGFASCAIFSSQKAFTLLDFKPAYDLHEGFETVRLHRNRLATLRKAPSGAVATVLGVTK